MSKKTIITVCAVAICACMFTGCAWLNKVLNLDGQNPGIPYDSSQFDIFFQSRGGVEVVCPKCGEQLECWFDGTNFVLKTPAVQAISPTPVGER